MSVSIESTLLKTRRTIAALSIFANPRHYSNRPLKECSEQFLDGLSFYWDTTPPTKAQLERASKFFRASPPELLYSTTKFRHIQPSELAEVAVFGRSNVGKSTLLNALMGHKICHTSSKPGRTRSMNYYKVGGRGGTSLAVLDMPGYGKGSHAVWGNEIMKYLEGRKQLKRAFLLVDPLHGLKKTDKNMLSLFRSAGLPHQIILNKVDRILFPKIRVPSVSNIEKRTEHNAHRLRQFVTRLRPEIQPEIHEGPEALGEIVSCSAATMMKDETFGINAVRWAVLAATGIGHENRRIEQNWTPISEQPISDVEVSH